MNYNDILRRLRYSFDFSDEQMIKIFEMGGLKTDRATVSNWMKKEESDDYEELVAKNLTIYLNGLISFKRGERPGGPPKPEKYLTNNLILKKLKIALELSTEDILEMYKNNIFHNVFNGLCKKCLAYDRHTINFNTISCHINICMSSIRTC